MLAFLDFPGEYRGQIRSTNPIKQAFKESRRRADLAGISPHDTSIVRLASTMLLEQNDEWAISRRYMTLDSVAKIYHRDEDAMLPRIAAA